LPLSVISIFLVLAEWPALHTIDFSLSFYFPNTGSKYHYYLVVSLNACVFLRMKSEPPAEFSEPNCLNLFSHGVVRLNLMKSLKCLS